MIQNPVWTLFRAAIHGLLGRLRFPEKLSGRVLITGKSEKFTVFRQVEVKIGSKYLVKPGAVFRIRFRFTGGPPGLNQKLSLIPIPLIVGFPGFRTKIRTIQEETGTFEGIYEWDSAEAAADYSESLAIRLMKMRAVPESVDQEIIPNTSVGEYLSSLTKEIYVHIRRTGITTSSVPLDFVS